VLAVVVGAALIGALAARSGDASHSKAVVKTMKVGGKTITSTAAG
jgi:hypothetical protein